jgi:hypothetical protein
MNAIEEVEYCCESKNEKEKIVNLHYEEYINATGCLNIICFVM